MVAVPLAPPEKDAAEKALAQQRRAQRLAHAHEVWSLPEQGLPAQAIPARVGVSSRTLWRFLQTPTFPEPQPRRQLSPFP